MTKESVGPGGETIIREARPGDAGPIVKMIHELALFERAPDECHATEAGLRARLFCDEPPVRGLVAEIHGKLVGYALYFFNFSTWECAPGLYLEDVYVRHAWRRNGVGRLFLERLATIALERGCHRFEWSVLDWNAPARVFYGKLGARALTEWVPYRMEGEALRDLAAGRKPDVPDAVQDQVSDGRQYQDPGTEEGTLRGPLGSRKVVVVHTDGGAEPNPGIGGWAAVLRFGNECREIRGGERESTNNRMELTAAIRALETLKQPCEVHLHTDSAYLKNGITRWIHAWKRAGWKRGRSPVKNVDLWQRLDELCAGHEVHWHWVRGHAGNQDNERADELCTAAIRELRDEGR